MTVWRERAGTGADRRVEVAERVRRRVDESTQMSRWRKIAGLLENEE